MSLDSKLALLKEAKEATQQTKAFQRLQTLFDEGTFVEIDLSLIHISEPTRP